MRIKNIKYLDLKMFWFDDINNDDMKVINDMRDLTLKVFWFEKILIRLRRLRLSRIKKLMIEFEFELNEKEKWSDLKFKTLLLFYCVLNSIFDNIIMIALGNRMLNDSKFDDAIAIWWFVIINLANVIMMMMLLCYNCISSHAFYYSWHVFINKLTFHINELNIVYNAWSINECCYIITLNHNNESQCLTMFQCSIISRFQSFFFFEVWRCFNVW